MENMTPEFELGFEVSDVLETLDPPSSFLITWLCTDITVQFHYLHVYMSMYNCLWLYMGVAGCLFVRFVLVLEVFFFFKK